MAAMVPGRKKIFERNHYLESVVVSPVYRSTESIECVVM